MTGQEHYEAAEDLLESAVDEDDASILSYLVAAAQVHATLAMAAADDREAAAEERIAGCVPEGTSKFGVVVAGAR